MFLHSSDSFAQNNLVIEPASINFGDVPNDAKECREEVKLINIGKLPLRVTYPWEFYYTHTDTIDPGDTLFVVVRRKTEWTGKLDPVDLIETNEIVDSICTGWVIYKEYELEVKGYVIEAPKPELECHGVDFGLIDPNCDSGIRRLKCTNKGDKTLSLTSVKSHYGNVSITTKDTILNPGETVYIRVECKNLTEGDIHDALEIETNEIEYRWKNTTVYRKHWIRVGGKVVNLY